MTRAAMVYRRSMTPVLAALLLAAAQADGHIGETPAPDSRGDRAADAGPARPTGSGCAAGPAPAPLPEATAPQHAKPAAPRQQLRILRAGLAAWRPTSSSATSMTGALRRGPALRQARGRAVRGQRRARPRAADRLQQPRRDAVPARRLPGRRGQLHASRSSCSRARRASPRGGSWCRSRGSAPCTRRRTSTQVAAELFDRALAVSRRADGLFNLQQLPLHRAGRGQPLRDQRFRRRRARAHVRAQDRGAELRLRRRAHAPAAARARRVLRGPARVHRGADHVHARARRRAASRGVYNPQAVKALVGIARTHRLQYTMDPDTLDSQQPARDEVTGEIIGKVYQESRVPPPAADRTGLKAAQTALDLAAVDVEPAGRPHDGNADRARRLVPVDVAPADLDALLRRGRRRFSTRRWRRTRSRATR